MARADENIKVVIDTLREELERGLAARRLLVDVSRMREAQSAYFAKRTEEHLIRAKRIEKTVDEALARLRKRT
jgi:hypothetical protein